METIDRLHEMLVGLDGRVTRQWAKAKIKLLTQKEPAAKLRLVVDNEAAASSETEATMPDQTPISVLLLTPKGPAITKLVKERTEDGEPNCFALGRRVADDAVMLIAATVGDLSRLASALHWWRFRRFSRVFLLDAPSGPDVLDAPAIGVCERGELKLSAALTDWPTEKDPVKLADRFTAGIGGRRVRLFAETETDGWESVIADANWTLGGRS